MSFIMKNLGKLLHFNVFIHFKWCGYHLVADSNISTVGSVSEYLDCLEALNACVDR